MCCGRVRWGVGVTDEAVAPAEATAPPEAGEAGRYDAFLSYSRLDKEFAVEDLQQELERRGKQVWVDERIEPGSQWRDRIRLGIEACKAMIFVISPESVASDACLSELDAAVSLHKLVVPVMYRPVDGALPLVLSESEWILLRDGDDRQAELERLVGALDADLEWRDQPRGSPAAPANG
jgi:hypothetical protein